MDTSTILEWLAVLCNLLYVILLMKERIACWWFGIIGSAISIYLFVDVKLYSEAILYGFYVLAGFYGWVTWSSPKSKEIGITYGSLVIHLTGFLSALALAFGLGYYFDSQTDAESPYFDASTSSFSFLATFFEAHKILSAWLYWIVINAASAYLYFTKGLSVYAGQMIVFTGMSIWGYIEWRKRKKALHT